MDLKPGYCVTDKVKLVRPLGKGAMGSIWLAEHTTLDTEVAVKFITEEYSSRRADALERFRREATAAARIKSPHVVQMLDHGVTADNTPYIVMELLEGESLADRIKREGTLAPRETLQVITHVCRALTAAHKLGVIHRDIKPQNIIITKIHDDLFAKVLDFGIATYTESRGEELTEPGTLVGTPEYLSRDLIATKGAQPDEQVDLWAVSVVAYKCLTGKIPFSGDTLALVLAALAVGKFDPPSRIRPELARRYDRWFQRAFHEDADRRFSNAEELAMSFQALVDPHTAGFDHRETQTRRIAHVPESPRRVATVVLTSLLGLGVGATIAFFLYERERDARPLAPAVAIVEGLASAADPVPPGPLVDPAQPPPAPLEDAGAPDDAAPVDTGEGELMVPAGTVWLGCVPGDKECEPDEQPGREMTVDAFFIDKLEVRVRDYELCATKRACSPAGLAGYALEGGHFGLSSRCNWRRDGREDYPLNCVTFPQAEAYCAWLGKRLPTEVEWERAARGDDRRIFPWGDEPADCLHTMMGGCGSDGSTPSGTTPNDKSPWGALDMAGNMREWVADWYDAQRYGKSNSGTLASASGSERVARGGSWGNGVARFMRISERDAYTPETRSVYIGFRCARSAK